MTAKELLDQLNDVIKKAFDWPKIDGVEYDGSIYKVVLTSVFDPVTKEYIPITLYPDAIVTLNTGNPTTGDVATFIKKTITARRKKLASHSMASTVIDERNKLIEKMLADGLIEKMHVMKRSAPLNSVSEEHYCIVEDGLIRNETLIEFRWPAKPDEVSLFRIRDTNVVMFGAPIKIRNPEERWSYLPIDIGKIYLSVIRPSPSVGRSGPNKRTSKLVISTDTGRMIRENRASCLPSNFANRLKKYLVELGDELKG